MASASSLTHDCLSTGAKSRPSDGQAEGQLRLWPPAETLLKGLPRKADPAEGCRQNKGQKTTRPASPGMTTRPA